MPSSISNSEPNGNIPGDASALPPAPPPPERELPKTSMGMATWVALLVFVVALAGWELRWRRFGVQPSYRNSEGLWAMQRGRIDSGEGDATVLIGSSRTMSNIQLPVWERLEGRRPIQLALEGTSPMTPLESLADDPDFRGRLIVGVTPGLFFSGFSYRGDVFEYYTKETPSQRAGQRLSMWLIEPYFAFYDPDFALFSILKRQPWPVRPGPRLSRDVRKLFMLTPDRNTRLWQKLENDPEYQELAKSIWREHFFPLNDEVRARNTKVADQQIARAAAAVAKLKERGVEVIFVLHPMDGEFYDFEKAAAPREQTWDKLLASTGARGIHFEDYPELQGHKLAEWSHLTSDSADRYTEALYRIIRERKAVGQEQTAAPAAKEN
jgi:hypothetical protein